MMAENFDSLMIMHGNCYMSGNTKELCPLHHSVCGFSSFAKSANSSAGSGFKRWRNNRQNDEIDDNDCGVR